MLRFLKKGTILILFLIGLGKSTLKMETIIMGNFLKVVFMVEVF